MTKWYFLPKFQNSFTKYSGLLIIFVLLFSLASLLVTGFDSLSLAQASTENELSVEDSLPNGIAAGDVNQDSAVLWARSTAPGPITFTYGIDLGDDATIVNGTVISANIPVTVTIAGLTENTGYQYRATTADGDSLEGTFRTAAAMGTKTGLRFGVSGDNDGENNPYISLSNVPERDLQFFLLHGDTSYADYTAAYTQTSTALDFSATTVEEYRLKINQVYTSNLGLNTWADLRASTGLFVTIDDHDVLNNFAGASNAADSTDFPETEGLVNDTARYDAGLQVVHEYHPVRSEFYGEVGGDGRMDNERKLYRYNTYGDDAAFIILDTRSFRDAQIADINFADLANDVGRYLSEALDPSRTILGSQQFQDLKDDLLDAQQKGLTWKFVAVPQPIQNLAPIGGSDRFEGYAAERAELLKFIEDNKITNVVFIAADLHATIVNNLTYQTALGGDQIPSSAFEIVTGPVGRSTYSEVLLQAGIGAGLIPDDQLAFYNSLPLSPDADDTPDDKDDYLRALVNGVITQLGYDTVGLEGSSIDAALTQGDYFAAHHYSWSEFEVAEDTQMLTVTTYGVPAYTAEELAVDPDSITGLTPEVISQFMVTPTVSLTTTDPSALDLADEPLEYSIYLPILSQRD